VSARVKADSPLFRRRDIDQIGIAAGERDVVPGDLEIAALTPVGAPAVPGDPGLVFVVPPDQYDGVGADLVACDVAVDPGAEVMLETSGPFSRPRLMAGISMKPVVSWVNVTPLTVRLDQSLHAALHGTSWPSAAA
jgi:hypothetical protein